MCESALFWHKISTAPLSEWREMVYFSDYNYKALTERGKNLQLHMKIQKLLVVYIFPQVLIKTNIKNAFCSYSTNINAISNPQRPLRHGQATPSFWRAIWYAAFGSGWTQAPPERCLSSTGASLC